MKSEVVNSIIRKLFKHAGSSSVDQSYEYTKVESTVLTSTFLQMDQKKLHASSGNCNAIFVSIKGYIPTLWKD